MVKVFTLFLSLCLLSSCSIFGSDEPEPVMLSLSIQSSDHINPSQLSAANPLVLNVYQLKAIDAFKSAQSLDLFQKDLTLLADSLINKQTLATLLPNTKKQVSITVLPGTKFIAVFAQFSNYAQAKSKAWLDVSKLSEADDKSISISIDSLTVNIISTEQSSFWSKLAFWEN